MQCQATTKAGNPCKAAAVNGTALCTFHTPSEKTLKHHIRDEAREYRRRLSRSVKTEVAKDIAKETAVDILGEWQD